MECKCLIFHAIIDIRLLYFRIIWSNTLFAAVKQVVFIWSSSFIDSSDYQWYFDISYDKRCKPAVSPSLHVASWIIDTILETPFVGVTGIAAIIGFWHNQAKNLISFAINLVRVN